MNEFVGIFKNELNSFIQYKKSNGFDYNSLTQKLKHLLDNKKISHYRAFCSVMTYSNCYKYTENIRVLKLIDRYFYHEK